MNAAPRNEKFDVFLSHSHENAELVHELARDLEDRIGFHVWLDAWILVPGGRWQQEMARGLDEAATCAVIIGDQTPRGWFSEEIARALNRQTRDSTFRVIPVLLPDADPSVVNDFLELRTWVRFNGNIRDPDALHRLESGIRGIAPGRGPSAGSMSIIDPELGAAVKRLTLLKELQRSSLINDDVVLEYQRRVLDEVFER